VKALVLLLLALAPVVSPPATIVSSGSAKGNTVALTFDAGADRGYAATILQTLEAHHIHASFGMTGKWAEGNQDLIHRMARDGDTFINHTYDHRSFTGLSSGAAPLTAAQRTWELQRTEAIIKKMTGRTTKPLFRPPFGDYDAATLREVRGLGYRYMVMWTLDSLGWRQVTAATILQHCVAGVHPGTILLMHVGIQSHDAQALEPLLRYLERRHYRFLTVPQMLQQGA
jgi:peptidoglycan/xylan/chitin deacetylase (PgdA/CDA1 family)